MPVGKCRGSTAPGFLWAPEGRHPSFTKPTHSPRRTSRSPLSVLILSTLCLQSRIMPADGTEDRDGQANSRCTPASKPPAGQCTLAAADYGRRPPSAHACAVQRRHRDNLQCSRSDARCSVNQDTLSDRMFISLTRETTGHHFVIHVPHRRVILVYRPT